MTNLNNLKKHQEEDRTNPKINIFNINIKKQIIHKSSYLSGQVRKRVIKEWLRYLVTTPLYKLYKINFNEENAKILMIDHVLLRANQVTAEQMKMH